MASPNVFQSSPHRAARRESNSVESSSPDLPSLQNIYSQKTFRPPLKLGSKVVPAPKDAATSFTITRDLWKSAQAAEPLSPSRRTRDSVFGADDSVEIVQIQPRSKGRKLRERKKDTETAKTSSKKEKAKKSESLGKEKPWKKYKSKQDAADADPEGDAASSNTDRETGTMSNHFAPANSRKAASDDPLCIEPAMARRIDWTPPLKDEVVSLDSDPPTEASTSIKAHSSAFKSLLQDYACAEAEAQAPVHTSDEDSSILKKRKRIELVTTGNFGTSAQAVSEKPPAKQKASKKKPRTITALATAAYETPTHLEPAPPSTSILDYISEKNAEEKDSMSDLGNKGKGKTITRKRATKTTKKKKKEHPPMPVLFSPGTALKQAADQDYVFGTSSQLAREQSPTLLRDIQAAMRDSNQLEEYSFTTPLNSDGIEPEQRSRLWGAGARDAKGDLLNIEIIDLANSSTELSVVEQGPDPFGHSHEDEQEVLITDERNQTATREHDSFINLSDILPHPHIQPAEAVDDGSLLFSDSDFSVSTNIQQPVVLPIASKPQPEHESLTESSAQATALEIPGASEAEPTRPTYELYSDIELAKEITSYGFKPVKRRNAMIALLDQCWQSKPRTNLGTRHTNVTLPNATTKSFTTDAARVSQTSPKRPRGRPRKGNTASPEPQEPPPSAQPEPEPKRPRGRPRKDASSPSKASSLRMKAKPAVSPKKTIRAAPKKRSTKKPIIEIPDSASENESDLASSPCSSAEEMFSSPPPLDLSLSMGDDTELSLTISPTDQQNALFNYITKAVTSTPRTSDPAQPSWHEKILLYDPILIEDMTVWLNSGQLTRVGFDGEVNPVEVKKWCESKSVCCLWKVNLRGKERKRY